MTQARDAIQFIWDQTVRGLNRDLTAGELIEFVRLPSCYDASYLTQQLYGLAEHHTRQVHTGLRGWFDGFEADLFPLPTAERCRRLIDGFGGAEAVRSQARAAIDDDDLRWALELSTWLVRCETNEDGRADGGTPDDRALLAGVLRTIAQRTTSANLRNYCLTRARELEAARSDQIPPPPLLRRRGARHRAGGVGARTACAARPRTGGRTRRLGGVGLRQ
ncbi:MAG: alkyl sulfatase dimerization domain-containing protein [Ilumatobacteraceae bacterium]